MSLKKKIIFVAIIFSAFLSVLNAQEPRDFIMNNIDSMKKDLGLSDDQVKKISGIMLDTFKLIEEKHIALERSMIDIKEQLLKDSPDLASIKVIIDKKNMILSDIEFITIKRDLSIKSILTQDQFMKWKMMQKPEPRRFFNDPFFQEQQHDKDPHFMKPMKKDQN
jgi:hypothetical protein